MINEWIWTFFIRRVCHLPVRHGCSDQSWRTDSSCALWDPAVLLTSPSKLRLGDCRRWRASFVCVLLSLQTWLDWTAVLLLCQTWTRGKFDWIAIFPSTCTDFDARTINCYEVGENKTNRESFGNIFKYSVFSSQNRFPAAAAAVILPCFSSAQSYGVKL